MRLGKTEHRERETAFADVDSVANEKRNKKNKNKTNDDRRPFPARTWSTSLA